MPACVCACVCVTLVRLFALFSGGAPPCSGCWRWGHANYARAPCLQSHMSRLSLRTPPRAAERVWCAHWLLSVPLCLRVKGLLIRENWQHYKIYMTQPLQQVCFETLNLDMLAAKVWIVSKHKDILFIFLVYYLFIFFKNHESPILNYFYFRFRFIFHPGPQWSL